MFIICSAHDGINMINSFHTTFSIQEKFMTAGIYVYVMSFTILSSTFWEYENENKSIYDM